MSAATKDTRLSSVQNASPESLKGLLKTVTHHREVIRHHDTITEETEKTITKNDAAIRAYAHENEKKMNKYLQNMDKLSTDEKLDQALDILFTNFDIVNRSMETKNALINDLHQTVKRLRNSCYVLLKANEQLLSKVTSDKK